MQLHQIQNAPQEIHWRLKYAGMLDSQVRQRNDTISVNRAFEGLRLWNRM